MYRLVLLALLSGCLMIKNRDSNRKLEKTGDDTNIRVVTFNILSTADLAALGKGYAVWQNRKDTVLRILKSSEADFLAVQECTQTQLEFLEQGLASNYYTIDARAYTSDSVLFYRKKNFTMLERGQIMLEEVYRLNIPRIAVWGKFAHKETGKELLIVGVHLDAKNRKREEAGKINSFIRSHVQSEVPVFLTGDFNIDPEEPEYSALIASGIKNSQNIIESEFFTFPFLNPIRRIDHVFFSGSEVDVLNWHIYDNPSAGVYSDHKAVIVDFFLGKT